MKKFTVTALAALLVSGVAMAETWTGQIEFTGSITADTCKFESTSNVDSHNIYVDMGDVATDVVTNSTVAAPVFSSAVTSTNGSSAVVKCSAVAKGLSMTLKPTAGTVVGTNVLSVTGGATGVGIALYDSLAGGTAWTLNNKVVFTKTAAELATANAAGGIPVRFAAAYVKTTGAIGAGDANAILPFEMKYE